MVLPAASRSALGLLDIAVLERNAAQHDIAEVDGAAAVRVRILLRDGQAVFGRRGRQFQIPGVEVCLRQIGQDVTAGRSIARSAQGFLEQRNLLGSGLTGSRSPIEAGQAGCPALVLRFEFDGALEQVFGEGGGFVHLFGAIPHHQRRLVLRDCAGGAAQQVRRRGGFQLLAGAGCLLALGDARRRRRWRGRTGPPV